MPAGVAPPGFSFARTGNGAQARWLVQAALYAYSGANVLVQTDTDATSNRFQVAVWHELRAEARGEELRVFWDGRQVVQKQDRTFPAAGRAGLWTKADSYTLFDDLTVIPLKVQP